MAEAASIAEALERFEAAMRQLEVATVTLQNRSVGGQAARGEAEALRQDHARITAELKDVRNKAEQLAEAGREAQIRIDQAERRIRALLGEEA